MGILLSLCPIALNVDKAQAWEQGLGVRTWIEDHYARRTLVDAQAERRASEGP